MLDNSGGLSGKGIHTILVGSEEMEALLEGGWWMMDGG